MIAAGDKNYLDNREQSPRLPNPKELRWELTPAVEKALPLAVSRFEERGNDLDLFVYINTSLGSDWLKANRLSPGISLSSHRVTVRRVHSNEYPIGLLPL